MGDFLGIDTSNYTTSAAVYNSSKKSVVQKKLPLLVKEGSLPQAVGRRFSPHPPSAEDF